MEDSREIAVMMNGEDSPAVSITVYNADAEEDHRLVISYDDPSTETVELHLCTRDLRRVAMAMLKSAEANS